MQVEKFYEDKWKFVKRWEEAKASREADPPIIPLIDWLNTLPNIYTTSSCYGRITLDLCPFLGRKKDHIFFAKWHEPVLYEEFIEKLQNYSEKALLWLRASPFILHLCAKDMETAASVIAATVNTGMKDSGIFYFDENRIMIRIEGVDRLAMLVGKDGKIILDDSALTYNYAAAVSKFVRNEERILNFVEDLCRRLKCSISEPLQEWLNGIYERVEILKSCCTLDDFLDVIPEIRENFLKYLERLGLN